jgi:hypothetical protein
MQMKQQKSDGRRTNGCPGSEQECPIPCAICSWPRPLGKTVIELARTGVEWEARIVKFEVLSLPILEGTGIGLKDSLVEPNQRVL